MDTIPPIDPSIGAHGGKGRAMDFPSFITGMGIPKIYDNWVDCPSTDQAGLCATDENRQNIKFSAF